MLHGGLRAGDDMTEATKGQMAPTHSQTAVFTFMEAALKTKTREQAQKLHAQWSAPFQGEPWWGVKTVEVNGESVQRTLDDVQTVLHARDVLSDWYLREAKARAAAKTRGVPAGGKLSDCPIPGWARQPWSKAQQTPVRFSRG